MRVRVYRNLHKNCWSIRACEGPKRGRLLGHAPALDLTNCRLIVSQKGRERVLRDGKRNVHAFIEGEYQSVFSSRKIRRYYRTCLGLVRYNPFRASTFRLKPDAGRTRPITSSDLIRFGLNGRCEAYSF